MRRPRTALTAAAVNATCHAYAELKRRINCGELQAGQLFKQHVLAEMLSISRTPVREALIRLAEEGLVEIRPRHGVRVKVLTLGEIAGIFEVLTVLEAHAARRVAEQGISGDALAHMEHANRTMLTATERRDFSSWIAADESFHRVLVSDCGNQQLRLIVHGLWDRTRRMRHLAQQQRTIRDASNREHADLIAAIRGRHGQTAFDVHHQHRVGASVATLEFLRQAGATQL